MADDLIAFDGGVLVADMVQSATRTDAGELTQYPIEDGSFIADHFILQPRTLSLTLVQTETPIVATDGFSQTLETLAYPERPPGTQSKTVPVRQSEFRPAPLLALTTAAQALLFGGGPVKQVTLSGLDTSRPLAGKEFKVHVLSAGAPLDRINQFHDALLSLMLSARPLIVTFKGQPSVDLILTSVTRTDAQGQAGKASFDCQFKQISTVETKTVDLPPVPKAKAPKQVAKPPEPTKEEQHKRLVGVLLQGSIGAGFQSEQP